MAVAVDSDGNFTIAPTTRVAEAGEKITWLNKRGPFVIHFNDRSPFKNTTLESDLNAQGVHEISAKISRHARVGVYEYASAVYDKQLDRVFIHVSGEIKIRTGR